MYKYAQILNNKAHWLFEDEMSLQELYFNKYSQEMVFVDITDNSLPIVEGWGYIDDKFIDPNPSKTLEELQTEAVQLFDIIAAKTYVQGFASSATGEQLWYDSDKEAQNYLLSVYTQTQEQDWETKVRFSNSCPAGCAPFRVRPGKNSPAEAKKVYLLNKEQIKQLTEDWQSAFFNIKTKTWQEKEQIYQTQSKEQLEVFLAEKEANYAQGE